MVWRLVLTPCYATSPLSDFLFRLTFLWPQRLSVSVPAFRGLVTGRRQGPSGVFRVVIPTVCCVLDPVSMILPRNGDLFFHDSRSPVALFAVPPPFMYPSVSGRIVQVPRPANFSLGLAAAFFCPDFPSFHISAPLVAFRFSRFETSAVSRGLSRRLLQSGPGSF